MDINDVIDKIDVNLLEKQYRTVLEVKDRLLEDLDDLVTPECRARVEYANDNLEGLLEFLDQVIIALRGL